MVLTRKPYPTTEHQQRLHARLALPPSISWDGIRYTGARLQRIDRHAALRHDGVQHVVVRKHFVAVIATSDAAALTASRGMRIVWSKVANNHHLPRQHQRKTLLQRGIGHPDPDDQQQLTATFQWQTTSAEPSASIVALATPTQDGLHIDLPYGNPRAIAIEVAALLHLLPSQITIHCQLSATSEQEAWSGCNAACAAALLANECHAPVSLVIEHAALPPSITQLQLSADTNSNGALYDYRATIDCTTRLPPYALLLTETASAITDTGSTPSALLAPPYDWMQVDIGSTGSSDNIALPAMAFAHESLIDELAIQANADPVQYRLAHLQDARGAQLIRSVSEVAGWQTDNGKHNQRDATLLRGRGFAYATTCDHEQPDTTRSWAAWVADVEYDTSSGELSVKRVVAGHDLSDNTHSGLDRIANSTSQPLLDAQARLAMSQVMTSDSRFDTWAKDNQLVPFTASATNALTAVKVIGTPAVERTQQPVQLKAGGAFALPAAAAVANAIYDATGVRLRSVPFSGEQVQLALAQNNPQPQGWRRFKKYGWLGSAVAVLGTTLTLALPWRSAIAPVAPPDPNLYSAATIERGRLVALAGDCVVCHTAPNGGTPNAGGHPLQTPFGTIYSTNITPDVNTGIGNWSYAAFERSLREGIHRDGRNLYPAFPYTAFAKITDADMQALYAYLMAQPAIESKIPESDLTFPFNIRPLLSGWNMLFHKPDVFQPEPDRSLLWNRGAYLVEGAGHCSACHSPRNMLGAEKNGRSYLTGGTVDDWEAPALTSLSKAPIPWDEEELFTYLRTGFSARHGTAAGPMAPVVAGLAQLPSDDVRAMAHYLASFNLPPESAPIPQPAPVAVPTVAVTSTAQTVATGMAGKKLFQGACAACHLAGTGPTLFGVRPSLAVNTNVHSDTPDNLINVILHGIREPANSDLGYMPGFADSFSDTQMVELVTYLRTTYAPDKPAWKDIDSSLTKLRADKSH